MGKPEGTGKGWNSGMTQERESRILKSVRVLGAVDWGFYFPTSLKGGHMAKESQLRSVQEENQRTF